ncbi:hypothetical protein [Qipengyuania atrilutea]|uniref:Uncharacterized protein n=1 Tax=Qipengyuania atrilutea TaxID=2744473 RepID=A0A850H7L4_9SPHN|nr:hypothetical protein [Actirhodobacter atriluteus]NVD45838.1 hypothetical protein [Actirhodobacter atriluteus]
MPIYAVSFEIKNDASYNDRYQSLMKQIRACEMHWEETTSFVLVKTGESLSDFETRLYVLSQFSHIRDKMLVLQVSGDDGVFRGVNNMPSTLALLMPNVVQK